MRVLLEKAALAGAEAYRSGSETPTFYFLSQHSELGVFRDSSKTTMVSTSL